MVRRARSHRRTDHPLSQRTAANGLNEFDGSAQGAGTLASMSLESRSSPLAAPRCEHGSLPWLRATRPPVRACSNRAQSQDSRPCGPRPWHATRPTRPSCGPPAGRARCSIQRRNASRRASRRPPASHGSHGPSSALAPPERRDRRIQLILWEQRVDGQRRQGPRPRCLPSIEGGERQVVRGTCQGDEEIVNAAAKVE